MKLTLHTFLTLDGVMQAPGGPEEDTDGHFEHGGWSFPDGDENFGSTMVGWFANADAFLMGRKTYEIFSGHWPHVTDPDNPMATKLNALPKYVASQSFGSVDWANFSLPGGDVVAEVTKLKELPGNELQVHGSGASAHQYKDDGHRGRHRDLPASPDRRVTARMPIQPNNPLKGRVKPTGGQPVRPRTQRSH